MSARLFVTGGSGFVGRHFLRAAPLQSFPEIICLTRTPDQALAQASSARVTQVDGDLFASGAYADRLAAADVVVHLAAATGRATPAEHFRTNLEGTVHLLEQCRRLGVRRFLYVSTIAVKFHETADYPYAVSKRQAEQAVRESGLVYSILRPTVIVGSGGGAWQRLRALARLPFIPLPGPGTARLQPVYVEDVARGLLTILEDDAFWDGTFELGGPERLTVESFLQRVRRRQGRRKARVIHLPAGRLIPLLRRLERVAPLLPAGPGQLSSFLEDGVAEPNPLQAREEARMTPIDAMLGLAS